MNVFEHVKTEPDRMFNSAEFSDPEDQDIIDEGGGYLMWCATCDCHCSPNRPCFCGAWVIRRDGKYFADLDHCESDWTEDWKYQAAHFYGLEECLVVARALEGPLTVHQVGRDDQDLNLA